jgi:hypothetical protein
MQEKQNPKEVEYAEALLKLSKNSVNPNKATLGEYLSTPMKRFPFRRPQDSGRAFETLLSLDKKKLFIFIIIFLAVFYIVAYLVLQSME